MKPIYLNGKTFTENDFEKVELSRKEGGIAIGAVDGFASETGIKGTETMQEVLKMFCVPPLGAEQICEEYKKYGYTLCNIGDSWVWDDKALENVTETECWKMLALSALYWEKFYARLYREKEQSNFRANFFLGFDTTLREETKIIDLHSSAAVIEVRGEKFNVAYWFSKEHSDKIGRRYLMDYKFAKHPTSNSKDFPNFVFECTATVDNLLSLESINELFD